MKTGHDAEVVVSQENRMKFHGGRWGVGGQCLSFIDDELETEIMKIVSKNLFWMRHCFYLPPHMWS